MGDWRNYVIAILSSFLLAGVTGWVTIGSDHVNKDELASLQRTIQQLQLTVAQLQTTVAVLNERIPRRIEP